MNFGGMAMQKQLNTKNFLTSTTLVQRTGSLLLAFPLALPAMLSVLLVSPNSPAKGLDIVRGKKATSKELTYKQSQVPTWTLMNKSKAIPKLNIGTEDQVKASDYTIDVQLRPTTPPTNVQVLASPAAPNTKSLVKVQPAVESKTLKISGDATKVPAIRNAVLPEDIKTVETKPTTKEIAKISDSEAKHLQGLILYEMAQNNALAIGLFAELLNDKNWKEEAAFQYSKIALQYGLHNEFQDQLFRVMTTTKDKDLARAAWQNLWENARQVPVEKMTLLESWSDKLKTQKTHSPGYLYNRSLFLIDNSKMQEAFDLLSAVRPEDKEYLQSQFHLGIILYRTNQVDAAIDKFQQLLKLTANDPGSFVRAHSAMTLARLKFQQGEYKESYQTYLKIDKTNSLWLDAMVEQAWTQILSKDYEGAAGNMFSLHTDFFKNNYAPESYLVRTVSYLNLCQFGDGMKVLETMKRKYVPLKAILEEYSKKHNAPLDYYNLVKNWLQHSDLKVMEGIPQSFLIEMAKYPIFQAEQKQINRLEDEGNLYNKLALDILKIEKDMLDKMQEINTSLAKNKGHGERQPASVDQTQRLELYALQHSLAKKARTLLKPMREAAMDRLEKEKANVKLRAAKALQKKFTSLTKELGNILDQNEVLQYELLSGAGEHIRYQMAGGEVNTDKRDELKAEKDKSVTWKFKGEIWADELGHYRSSLKNVCPTETGSL